MENGVYRIDSGTVEVEFKGDEGNKNLPHVYISHLAVNFDVAPDDVAAFSVVVVSASGFEIKVAELDVLKEEVALHEFCTQLPLARGDVVKMVYPNVDNRKIKIRVFHTYRI